MKWAFVRRSVFEALEARVEALEDWAMQMGPPFPNLAGNPPPAPLAGNPPPPAKPK
jgi:hypothetical protein